MTTELTTEQFKSTFGSKMIEVSLEEESPDDLWLYISKLEKEGIIHPYVLEKELVEMVSRNSENTYEHILLSTPNKNIFIVIIFDLKLKQIWGHFKLDLEVEYGLK